MVGLLSATILRSIAENPKLPPEISSQFNLDNINFISNDRLQSVMESTAASPAQVAEAMCVNKDARFARFEDWPPDFGWHLFLQDGFRIAFRGDVTLRRGGAKANRLLSKAASADGVAD